MDARFWDIKPSQGGFGSEVNLLAQDCGCDSSKWWLTVPNLPDGESRTFRLYMGNGEQKRNQGIEFTGNEIVRHGYDALFDGTDNLKVDIDLELTETTLQTAALFDRWQFPNQGFKLDVADVSSILTLRAYANSSTCDIPWDSNWSNTNVLFSYRFAAAAGNDLFIDANGVNVVACDTDEPSITPAVGTFFDVGLGLDSAIIREVAVFDTGELVSRYGFDARYVSETTAVDPTYTGTIQDYGPNNLDLTYTFTRSQAGLTKTVASLALASDTAGAAYSDSLVEILGGTFLVDPFADNSENTNAFGYELFDAAINSIPAPRPMMWAIFLGSFGLFFAVVMFWFMRNVPLALFGAAMPLAWGSINGFLPIWWLILWVLLFVTAYGAQQWGESS